MAEVGAFGVVRALGAESKEAHTGVGVISIEGGWGDGHSYIFSEWVCEGIWDG